MNNVRIGREPILDSNGKLCAYSVLYKEEKENSYSSASVISDILNKFGTQSLLGNRKAFVRVDEKFLLHDLILSIPKEFFIFSLDSDILISDKILERIHLLKSKGYSIGIKIALLRAKELQQYISILHLISYVKIEIDSQDSVDIQESILALKSNSITVVAINIDDAKAYKKARELRCDWFQGYFFAQPVIIENARYEPRHMEVLKLYRLLMEDANIDEITREFELNHEITVQLLQFINSGAFHFRNKISSVHHILTLVGRIPLAQWLMLMIYSKSVTKNSERSPLMLMAKNRTELMEHIIKKIMPDVRSNTLGEAYFVGVLSLIDTLFSRELSEIIKDINISDNVKNALLYDEGQLGDIYKVVRAIEAFDTGTIEAFETKYKLTAGALNGVIVKSIEGVNKFENPTLAE